MKAGVSFVSEAGVIPEETPYRLDIVNDDGWLARQTSPGGPAEVWLVGRPEDGGTADRAIIVIPFPTLEMGERAGRIFQGALEQANAILDETPPAPGDGHEHAWDIARFSRTKPAVKFCRRCNLVDES